MTRTQRHGWTPAYGHGGGGGGKCVVVGHRRVGGCVGRHGMACLQIESSERSHWARGRPPDDGPATQKCQRCLAVAQVLPVGVRRYPPPPRPTSISSNPIDATAVSLLCPRAQPTPCLLPPPLDRLIDTRTAAAHRPTPSTASVDAAILRGSHLHRPPPTPTYHSPSPTSPPPKKRSRTPLPFVTPP